MKENDASRESRESRDMHEQIIAYLTDEMNPSQRTEFEGAMRADEALRLEVEAFRTTLSLARDWALEPPPGRERVGELNPPRVQSRHRVRFSKWLGPFPVAWPALPVRPSVWRGCAAAVIFVLGFTVGRWPSDQPGASPREAVVTSTTPAQLAGADVTRRGVAQPVKTTPTPVPKPPAIETREALEETMPKPCGPARTTELDGRVIVETTLCKTGGRATWVVDGGFQLAQNTLAR